MSKFISLLLVVLVCLSVSVMSHHAEEKRPNVIIFMTDDQSPMDWEYTDLPLTSPAAWGYTGAKVYSPHVDKLASSGMVFTRAYASSSVCTPSRYTTLTGRYASRTQAPSFMKKHRPGTMTRIENIVELDLPKMANLPSLLQKSGYRTGFVGKSHLVDHDILNRPDKWEEHGLMTYGKDADPNDPEVDKALKHNQKWWQERIADYGFDYVNSIYSANLRELFNEPLNVHNIEWTTKAALEFIEQSKDQPFFLYYAPTLPHGPDPWIRDKEGNFKYSLDADPKITGEGVVKTDYSFMPTREEIKKLVKERGFSPKTAYVTLMDAAVGALVDKLDALGLTENTILIVTSDHGAWRYGKTTLYEGGLRVPLVVRWPAKVKPGSTYPHLVSNIDNAPTIFAAAGVTPPKDYQMDGKSLLPVLTGKETKPVHEAIFAEIGYSRAVITESGWKYIAVRYPKVVQRKIEEGQKFPRFKGGEGEFPYLVRNMHLGHNSSRHNKNYFQSDQLYDLNTDPMEKDNLAEKDPAQLKKMQNLLANFLKTFHDRPFGEFTSASSQ